MNSAPLPPPIWVDTKTKLEALAPKLARQTRLAVDTESNSLYAYQEQVCLLQISTTTTDYLIDALALGNLSPLEGIFSNPKIEKIFHAAEYDVLTLSRDFDFDFANIFDTMQAARTLGLPAVGLANLLKEKFDITLNKRFQKADWGQRPLSADMIDYARLDTRYLFQLRDLLDTELREKERTGLAYEDFARLCHPNNHTGDKNNRLPCEKVSGSRGLTPRQLTILNTLCLARDKIAQKLNRPPFKVLNDERLVRAAKETPNTEEELTACGYSSKQVAAFGKSVLAAIQQGETAPLLKRKPASARPDEVLIKRQERLKEWRKKTALALEVESDIILPRPHLAALAEQAPQNFEALAGLMSDLPWRLKTYGQEILQSIVNN